ncbi:MAG: DUF1802 family protein [Candidatus Calescibacterium sp.]|nr:DUF1802 family protein [Candidatus Calescibacterium sp.]MDW8087413.1 DUF1802 family protein [Candidatus Calescibacterium sp.]
MLQVYTETKGKTIKINSAFKEWRSVIEALGNGEQIIILRKGGIIEDEGDFVPKEKYFFLFPTLTHEREGYLKKTYHKQQELSEDELEIKYWADTVLARKVEDEETLKKLSPYHIWSDETVLERFHRWGKNEVWCLVVRVFKLKNPIKIKMKPEYGGCKSWIDISENIDIQESTPVLSDKDFEAKFNEVVKILEKQK